MTPEDRMKKLRAGNGSAPTEEEWLAFRSTAHRSVARRRIAGALGGTALLLALVGGAYAVTNGSADDQRGPGVAGSPTPTEAPSPTTSPSTGDQAEIQYRYLQQWFVEDGKLSLWYLASERTLTPARVAMENLLFVPGPLAEGGVTSAIPEGTRLLELEIDDGLASVSLSGDFPDESDEQQRLAHAQIVYTLTQFPTVDEVSVSWESADSGGVASAAEDRSLYDDLLPPIVVEQPVGREMIHPKPPVERTFTLSGIANVFEANVSWRLVDEDGNTLQEGFTTATCGTGCWGTFEEKITFEGPEDHAILQVFQASAEDGSPMNMVEIPLDFEKER